MMKDKDIKIALPFMGEFGSKAAKHVPGVAGIPRPLIICHEAGEEALYPDATERYTYERPLASERSAGGNRYQVKFKDTRKLKWPEGRVPYMLQFKAHFEPDVWEEHLKTGNLPRWQRKYIEPTAPFKMPAKYFIPQNTGTYKCDFDVLLFARCQQYAHGRNWIYWNEFHEALKAEGIKCLVAGQPDSTAKLTCPAIWEFVDEPSQILDATIWAIHNSRFRIGTPTGTTLLSQLCAKPPIMIINDNGMDSQGSKMSFPAGYYFKIDNNHRVGWRVISHWMNWRQAVKEFMEIYSDQEKFENECKEWVHAIHRNLAIPDSDKQWQQVK